MVVKAVEDSCRRNGIDRVTAEELEKIRGRMPTPKIFGQVRRAERSGAQGPREWERSRGEFRGKRRVFKARFPRTNKEESCRKSGLDRVTVEELDRPRSDADSETLRRARALAEAGLPCRGRGPPDPETLRCRSRQAYGKGRSVLSCQARRHSIPVAQPVWPRPCTLDEEED